MIFILIALFLILSGLAVTVFMISRGSKGKKKSLVEGLPLGSIVAWNDTTIPDGWTICDGTNNTPDLRNRFIIGSNDNYPLNSTGGNSSVVISSGNMPAYPYMYKQYGFYKYDCSGGDNNDNIKGCSTCPGYNGHEGSSSGIIQHGKDCTHFQGANTVTAFAQGGNSNPINIIPPSTYMIYIKKISNGNDADCIGLWYGGDVDCSNLSIPSSISNTIYRTFIIGDDGTNLNKTTQDNSTYMITSDNLPPNIYTYNFAGIWGGGNTGLNTYSDDWFNHYCSKKDLMAQGDYDSNGDFTWSQQKVSLLPPFISLPYCNIVSGIPSGFIVAIDTDNIPDGWILCDGNNDTPNLGGRIPKSTNSSLNDCNSTGGSEKLYLNKDNIPRYQTIEVDKIDGSGDTSFSCNAIGDSDYHNMSQEGACKGQWNTQDRSQEDTNCPFGRVTGGNANPDPIPLLPPYVALNFIMKL